jgi:beta-N-acetylhexosaminidase
MKAVSSDTPLPEAAVAAIQAGCDAVLLCNSTIHEQVDTLEALIRAVETGQIKQTRIDDALKRQHAAKSRMKDLTPTAPAPLLDVVGCTAHQDVAREMAAWL